MRNNESTKQRKSEQRDWKTTKVRNNQTSKWQKADAKQRHYETITWRYETTQGRCRLKQRNSEAKKANWPYVTSEQRIDKLLFTQGYIYCFNFVCVFDAGSTLYTWYTNVLCLLGISVCMRAILKANIIFQYGKGMNYMLCRDRRPSMCKNIR